jgi:ABC-type transporter Mla subunit MlaD
MAEITIRVSDRVLKVAGILLFGICVVWVNFHLWSSGFYQPKYHLRMYVADAAGLPIGTPVRVDGLAVGTVAALNLVGKSASPGRTIELVLRVEKRDQEMIRSDSVAHLLSEGLLGLRFIDIDRGFNGSPLSDGEEIPAAPTRPITTEEVINSVAKWVDCMKQEKSKVGDKGGAPIEVSPKVHR